MSFNVENLIGTGTTEERLEWCIAAQIGVKAHGQWYSTGYGRTFYRADLGKLMELEQYLRRLQAQDTSQAAGAGSKTNFATFRRPL